MSENPTVVTIGGANAETYDPSDLGQASAGGKAIGEHDPLFAGGSAINHSCRLLAQGIPAIPIVPLIDDFYATFVIDALRDASTRGSINEPIPRFLDIAASDEARTAISFVRDAASSNRKITTKKSRKVVEEFGRVCEGWFLECCNSLRDSGIVVGAVMIGHIHAEAFRGGITLLLSRHSAKQGIPIYANLGSSQFMRGRREWEGRLGDISFFQLDVREVKAFYASGQLRPDGTKAKPDDYRLEEILAWFRNQTSVIITMAEFGAIAQLKGHDEIVVIPGFELQASQIKDTTGAGDAFAAGFVSWLVRNGGLISDSDQLIEAMTLGAKMGAYACTTPFGAAECPSQSELHEFFNNIEAFAPIQKVSISDAQGELRRCDLQFRSN